MFTSSGCNSRGIHSFLVTFPCQQNANMLVQLHLTCRECWGHQPKYVQGPLMECFSKCHFLIPSTVFQGRSLVEENYVTLCTVWCLWLSPLLSLVVQLSLPEMCYYLCFRYHTLLKLINHQN